MNFEVSRKIENRVYTVQIEFKSLGSDKLTEEEEARLFGEMGFPEIDLGGSFTGTYSQSSKGVVEDKEYGKQINFIINSKRAELREGFVARYDIPLDSIKSHNIDGIHLLSHEKAAEAFCLLYEKVISERIVSAVQAVHDKLSSFVDCYPKELII